MRKSKKKFFNRVGHEDPRSINFGALQMCWKSPGRKFKKINKVFISMAFSKFEAVELKNQGVLVQCTTTVSYNILKSPT